MDAIKFTCAKCDYQFVGTADNFQCPSCHKHSAYSGCLSCGTQLKSTPSTIRRYCGTRCYGDSKITLPTKECLECRKQFRCAAHKDREYCSSECGVIGRKKAATVSCLICGNNVISTPAKPKKYCSKACMALAYRKLPDTNCLQCGVTFRPRSDVYKGQYYVQKYCSKDCHSESLRKLIDRRYIIKETRLLHSMAAMAKTEQARIQDKSRSCVKCGNRHILPKGKWSIGWSCNNCVSARKKEYRYTDSGRRSIRAGSARRKALERGARVGQSIDPIAVFERDKWRCHICGIKTKKALRGTYEPLAPELDHITTLADGGKHSWGNVACSCRKCNHAKSSRSFGQQGLDFAVVM